MMDTALLLARLLLAGVFALAGVARLADWSGARRAAIDFGVPARLKSCRVRPHNLRGALGTPRCLVRRPCLRGASSGAVH